VFGIGQVECVSYGVVCGMFYCGDSEKALINKDDHRDRELRVQLRRLVVETHLGHFFKSFPLIYAHRSNYFMHFRHLFIELLIQGGMTWAQ
jgi:hypothetical protein